jgi:hypothetical protein
MAADEPACLGASDEVSGWSSTLEGGPCQYCRWIDWVRVSVADDGTCAYEALPGSCAVDASGGEFGCSWTSPCHAGQSARYRVTPKGVDVLVAPVCSDLPEASDCYPNETADPAVPECACHCDAAFPGT